jgi:hypothetical protein
MAVELLEREIHIAPLSFSLALCFLGFFRFSYIFNRIYSLRACVCVCVKKDEKIIIKSKKHI